jgi:hypothetical protein
MKLCGSGLFAGGQSFLPCQDVLLIDYASVSK